MTVDPFAFTSRSVLVTGHTGFKGSWMCLALARLDARVHGLSLPPPTVPSHYELTNVREHLAGEWLGDVRDASLVERALEAARPDIIFHFAAQSTVLAGYADPAETFSTNVMGTVSLLDAVRRRGAPAVVVVITTDKVYEQGGDPFGFRETDPLGGHDPYSASKGAAELVVQSYRRSYFSPDTRERHGVRLASARAGNVIGGGDWTPNRIVVDIVAALRDGRSVAVRNPGALRPWQHVVDAVWGYLTLAHALLTDRDPILESAWNFGPAPTDERTVAQLVTAFCRAWGGGTWHDASTPGAPAEAAVLRLAVGKAASRLGVRPLLTVDEAIERTATWYRRLSCGEAKAAELTSDDLALAESRVRGLPR